MHHSAGIDLLGEQSPIAPESSQLGPPLATQFGGLLSVKFIGASRVFLGSPRNATVQEGLPARLGPVRNVVENFRHVAELLFAQQTRVVNRCTSERGVVPVASMLVADQRARRVATSPLVSGA